VKLALTRLFNGFDTPKKDYDETVPKIEAQDPEVKDLVKKTLKWNFHAQRHLTVGELQHALAVEPQPVGVD
jgi:hypothetical protein